MQKSLWWRIYHSLWIVFTFLIMFNWTSYLYIGIRAKKKKWLIWSSIYFVTGFLLPVTVFSSVKPESILFNLTLIAFFVMYIFGIVHALAARKEYLLSLIAIEPTQEAELIKRVEKEYNAGLDGQHAPQASSIGNPMTDEDRAKVDYVKSIVVRINASMKKIKFQSEHNSKYMLVESFLSEIDEFESVLPAIAGDYEKGLYFIQRHKGINDELKEIEKKISASAGNAKQFYEKTLSEKLAILQEIDNMKAFLDEGESKLHYILSILQKIEAVIEASEVSDGLTSEEATNLNMYMETFSSSLKDTIKSIKL